MCLPFIIYGRVFIFLYCFLCDKRDIFVSSPKDKNNQEYMIKQEWIEKGYIDEAIPAGIDLKAEIRRLCEEKNAVVLAH